MEETKLNNDPILPQEQDDLEVAQWQFQSDPEPYQKSDSVNWIWQNYLDDENLIIEDAYLLKQESADLKNYEIDLKKMVQVNKQDKDNIRRIRRQGGPSRFLMKMPEAKLITKDQKTMNEAFGTVQHFLEYIMKRTPEAYALYQRLKAFSLDRHRVEFEDLVQQVAVCIKRGAEVRAKIIKKRTGSNQKAPNHVGRAKMILDEIEKNSSTLRKFLETILKAYTMETFLYGWLNELLRSEDWEEINLLTPYLVCLLYTFQLSDFLLKSQNSENEINQELGFVVKHRLYLYRGTVLTKEQFLSYNPNKTKYFSWNAMTSTSRDRNTARNFISLKNITDIGVMFSIEIDFGSHKDYQGITDVSKYSRYPREQEVILAPGTVFKLLEISLVENGLYEIRLKVTKNLREAQEDVALLGILQEQAISKGKATIAGLPSQKGFKMLELVRGNQSIRKLEIRDSGIEQHLMEEIESVRLTTNVRKENIKLVGNTIVVSGLSVLACYFSIENLAFILGFNQIRFRSESMKNDQIASDLQINRLIFMDKTIEMFRQNGQSEELWKRLKNEIQTFRVCLSMQETHIEDNQLRGFFECFKKWNSLKNLDLAFNKSQASSINLDPLSQAISSSKNLIRLSLKFPFSDEGLRFLENACRPLESLQRLSLDCHGENQISDKGLRVLKNAFTSLVSLQHLSVKFTRCSFSEEGLDDFTSVTTSLNSLQNFDLLFRSCKQISEIGLNSAQSTLMPITMLQHLSCDFFTCSQISNEGLNSLNVEFTFQKSSKCFQIAIQFFRQTSNKNLIHLRDAVTSLISLQYLNLKFTDRNQISDEKLNHLNNALRLLTSLQRLSLNLTLHENISLERFSDLNTTLKSLESLQYLSLDFWFYNETSDEDLSHLRNTLISLQSLKHLVLSFRWGSKISDKGLNCLSNALLSLTHLQHLSLNFGSHSPISDEGLDYIKNALLSLASLRHLSLHFGYENNISDKGVNYLKNALLSFPSLHTLSLSFEWCRKVSDEGLNHLKDALLSLPSLRHLSLSFESCFRISDKGLNYLKNALLSLPFLHHLSLNFASCKRVSDEGLNHLKNALLSLPSLGRLYLNFDFCYQISIKGLDYLMEALVLLTSLLSLHMNFDDCKEIRDDEVQNLRTRLKSIISLTISNKKTDSMVDQSSDDLDSEKSIDGSL